MANSNLTPTQVTREALRILHEKLTFIGTINRQYDDSFARSGAKIGDTLKIRLPNQYTVRTGKAIDTQDNSESSVSLTVATQKGVDVNFSSAELTMDIDDFSKRILEPAMAVLASNIESDVLQSRTKDVYNLVGTAGTTPNDTLFFGQARAKLNQYLAPKDDKRHIQLDSLAMATMVDHLQGLFHDSTQVARQYRDGFIGRHVGFNWMENERIYVHTNGSDHTTVTVNDTVASGDSVITTAGGTVTVGSVFTIANVNAVHPETKDTYGHLQQFVVTAVSGNDWTVSPSFISTGAKQNIDALPANSAAITLVGSASTAYEQHLAYHEDFATFATADLTMPTGVDFAAREVYDGISMRIVRAYDINNDNFPCRIDLLYGSQTLYPQLACRITG